MGYIKEPKGVDLVIGPSVLTDQDRKMISQIIANYKRTGKLPSKTQRTGLSRKIGTGSERTTSQPAPSKRGTPKKRVLA